ncbi:PRTRC system protein C [Taibaiella chishuiensis]|uniref:PRTRC genetic system protein C n=1 Tax=Taibaiella chishuiensis TaxID=1434707 RepID=A0A2P8D0V3_9BACT|nr:PRTRC system protein C [Taibaiella chishuiensis]PSK90851.1 PRTRC genetic system protein C [Taibaiella chishuiensis]
MIIASEKKRVFIYKDTQLSDPSINLSKEAVLNFYANTYPELNNATIDGPEIKDTELHYKFLSTLGTKG